MSYYQGLNQGVKAALGGLNCAKICLYSVNFDEIEKHQHLGQWDKAADILSQAAQYVEAGGADFLLICTNPVHKKSCIKWLLKLKPQSIFHCYTLLMLPPNNLLMIMSQKWDD